MRQTGRLPPGSLNLKASPSWHRTGNVSLKEHRILGSYSSEAILSQLNDKESCLLRWLGQTQPPGLEDNGASIPEIVPTLQHVPHSGVTETRLVSDCIISWDLRQCTEPVHMAYNWTVCWRAGAWDMRQGQEGKRYSKQKLEACKASSK